MHLKPLWGICGLCLIACGSAPAPRAPVKAETRWTGEEYAGFRPENMNVADRALADRVRQRLTQHPYVHATELEVIARQGEVRMSGKVGSDFERQVADQVARQVPGVKRVSSELGVVAAQRQDPDQRLRNELEASLKRAAPGSGVRGSVEDGVVTLTGTLSDWDVYDAVMLAVYRAGPKSVENEIEVTTREADEFVDLAAPPAASKASAKSKSDSAAE